MSNLHFIIDFETLGQNVFKIPLLDCSYVVFDWDRFTSNNPYTLEELVSISQKDKFNVQAQKEEYGASWLKADLDWWLSQSEEAKAVLKPSIDDITVHHFFANLIKYIENTKINYWWSRSNTFDPVLLARFAYLTDDYNELFTHLKYWKVRDTRTWIDAKLDFPKENGFCPVSDQEYWDKNFVKHDSRYDIAADILRLQTIARAEEGLEISGR